MSWQPENTRWQGGAADGATRGARGGAGGGAAGLAETAGALVRPVLLGLAAGLAVALAGLVVVGVVVLGTGGDSDGGTAAWLATGLGLPLLALACALGAGLAGRRPAGLRPGLGRRAALGTGAGVGAVALALGLAPGLRWLTLPLYLVAVAVGTVLGTRRTAPGR